MKLRVFLTFDTVSIAAAGFMIDRQKWKLTLATDAALSLFA